MICYMTRGESYGFKRLLNKTGFVILKDGKVLYKFVLTHYQKTRLET